MTAETTETPPLSGRSIAVRALVGVFVGAAVIAAAAFYLGVKPGEVAQQLKAVPLWALCACAASSYVVLAFQSLRWHRVMAPLLGLSYGLAYRAQIVGYMFNAILPARSGDLLRVQYLGRKTGKSRATILGTELVDRWLDFWGWIPVIAIIALITPLPRWAFTAAGMFGALLLSWGLLMIFLTRRGHTPRPGSKWSAIYGSLQMGILAFRSKRMWVTAFLFAPLPWLWEAFVLSQTSTAFGIHINLANAFCVLIGFNIATVVPSPGGMGTVEAGGSAALVFFGADQSKALAFMFVYHFAQLIPGIVTGIVILITEGDRLFGTKKLEAVPPPSESA